MVAESYPCLPPRWHRDGSRWHSTPPLSGGGSGHFKTFDTQVNTLRHLQMNNQTKHCWELGILETLFTYHQIYWSHHGHFRWRRQVRRKDMKLPTATKGCFVFCFGFEFYHFPNVGKCFGKKIHVATNIQPFLTTLVWSLSMSHTRVQFLRHRFVCFKDFALKCFIYFLWKKKMTHFPWSFFRRSRCFFLLWRVVDNPAVGLKTLPRIYPEDISHQAGVALNTFVVVFALKAASRPNPIS